MKIPKRRGRPKKVRPRFFVEDANLLRIEMLSSEISRHLGSSSDEVVGRLAEIAIRCETMRRLQRKAPIIRKRKGNREKVHIASLIKDCAELHEQITGENAKTALAKLGGWAEDAGKDHLILKYAKAVMAVLDIKHSSLRRQVRQAMGLFE